MGSVLNKDKNLAELGEGEFDFQHYQIHLRGLVTIGLREIIFRSTE